MIKAVLVLDDVPETCSKCEFSKAGSRNDIYCGRGAHAKDTGRADDCPIKKVPLPLGITFDNIEEVWRLEPETDFGKGWNACLRRLEGKDVRDEIKKAEEHHPGRTTK